MTASPPDVDDRPEPDAQVLAGRYRLVRVVGSGGMGVVWEAVSTWTGRRVAVKLMQPRVSAAGVATFAPDVAERFLREAQATARVRHPNVVDVLDMGRDAERAALFIVYELLEGETLRALLERRGRLAPDEAAEALLPVMEGLAAAHRESVLHRDLKPENVILAREADGHVVPRLIDFGIARVDDAELTGLTRTGAALGTAHYMSPEQARGARDLDARSDVWSVGVMWFEALTGALPYEGTGYNEVLAKILTTPPPRLAAALPGAARPLADVVDRALSRDRDARHASVDEFIAAMRAALLAKDEAAPPSPAPSPTSRRVALIVACSAALAAGVALASGVTRRGHAAGETSARAPARHDALPAASTALPSIDHEPDATPPARAEGPTPPAARPTVTPARRAEGSRQAPLARRVEAAPAPRVSPPPRPLVNGAVVLEP